MSTMARLLRGLAIAWLMGLAPIDLATTIARHLSRLFADADPAFTVLVLARVVSVAMGTAVGAAIWRRAPAGRGLAGIWLVTESVTLVLIWTTSLIPTNRPPGLLGPVIALYVAAAATVWLAARMTLSDQA